MLNTLRNALAYVGRHAAASYALSIVLGLGLPQIAAALRPLIPITIFCFIVLSFARANLPGLKAVFSEPKKLIAGLMLSALLPPALGALVLASPLLEAADPGVRLAIVLMAAAPALMAAPAFAGVIGLENSFALTTLVLGMVITPLSAPFFASLLAGADVPISPYALAERLAIFIGGGILLGMGLRKLMGVERIVALKNELDGWGVVLYFLFAIAAMDGVIDMTLTHPAFVIGILVLSCGYALLGFGVAYLITRSFGFNDRFSMAICIGLRNMGLLIAPIFSVVPQTTFLYFALAQVPVYIAPMVLKALKAKLEPHPAGTPES